MRRRFFVIFLVVIMSACAPEIIIEPEMSGGATEAPSPVPSAEVSPVTAMPQWIEVYARLAEESREEREEDDGPYTETVAVPDSTPTSLGMFTVTAYCECVKCNGKWTGYQLNTPTQAGMRYPVVGYTVSVDPEVIPLGSVVELEGLGARFAQDTGSAIKGNKIDLFLSSHEEALEFGVKQLEVWLYG
ncbi:MAG: 3D domain-containing protein [Oscillospiraceae bacterium]|nr:3D domain-containing protein [Oscillospiraceae bacterium]